jgi:putative membrane protein
MRHLHLAVIILFAGATVIFCAQNLQIVEVSLLRFSAHVPLAFLIAGIYILGAITGGSLLALLRQSFKGAKLAS